MDPDIYIDNEPRNAIRIRAGVPTMGMGRPIFPAVRPPTVPAPTYAVAPSYAPAPVYAHPAFSQFAPTGPAYVGPAYNGPAYGGGLFRRPLDVGRGAALLAQIVASLMPLPAKPNALGKVEDDIANTMIYQQALAQHAQRDERIRTIGAVLAELAGLV